MNLWKSVPGYRYARPVQTEEEAQAFIAEKKSRHWDATHNVYAYILREGNIQRYSDDGEPQGTAGIPRWTCFRSPMSPTWR